MYLKIVKYQHLHEDFNVLIGQTADFTFPTKPYILGRGFFATVQIISSNGVNFAAKVFKSGHALEQAQTEVAFAHEMLGHTNLLQIYRQYPLGADNSIIHVIVYECLEGGTLYDMMLSGHLNEAQNRNFVQQLLNGVSFIHSKNYIHLDINPSNILFTSRNADNTVLKIADFSTACAAVHPYTEILNIQWLTRHAFSSPELLLRRKFTQAHDMWSIGVIIYYLMTHNFPFCRYLITDKAKIKMLSNTYEDMEEVSEECKDLVRRLLRYKPEERLNAQKSLKHNWFKLDRSMLENVNNVLREPVGFRDEYSPEKRTRLIPRVTIASPLTDEKREKYMARQKKFEEQLLRDINRSKIIGSYLSRSNAESDDVRLTIENVDDLENCTLSGTYKDYRFSPRASVLGIGGCGKVIVCRNNSTKFAAKVAICEEDDYSFCSLTREVENLFALGVHQNIVQLFDYFITSAVNPITNRQIPVIVNIYEYMSGGTLDEFMQHGPHNEKVVRHMIKQLLQGLEFIHSKGFIHADIKTANCLLTSLRDDAILKLADFGGSIKIDDDSVSGFRLVQTIMFASPELVFVNRCFKSHDIWSAGVILYLFLNRDFPFISDLFNDEPEIYRQEKWNLHNGTYREIARATNECKDLLKNMFIVDPHKRITATQALQHSWFNLPDDQLCEAASRSELQLNQSHNTDKTCLPGFRASPCNMTTMTYPYYFSTSDETVSSVKSSNLFLHDSHESEEICGPRMLKRSYDCYLNLDLDLIIGSHTAHRINDQQI